MLCAVNNHPNKTAFDAIPSCAAETCWVWRIQYSELRVDTRVFHTESQFSSGLWSGWRLGFSDSTIWESQPNTKSVVLLSHPPHKDIRVVTLPGHRHHGTVKEQVTAICKTDSFRQRQFIWKGPLAIRPWLCLKGKQMILGHTASISLLPSLPSKSF